MQSLFGEFNIIEFSVYSAPPRRFICLLSLLSCGSVISGTCPRTRTVPDRTPAIGTHRGGSDALPESMVSKDYLVVFELYRLSHIALWIDSHTEPSSQKKQNQVWLILRFISERQVYTVVKWMCRNAGIIIYLFFFDTAYMYFAADIVTPVRDLPKLFQCISISVHINTYLVSLDCACCCRVQGCSVNHILRASRIYNH